MRINLNQLNVFYLAALHKSMTGAAKALYVSTPAVTMQIKKLEAWLGVPLFERGQGELRLTERGRALYDAVQPVFGQLGELERYVQSLARAEEEEIRLGTHHLPGNYFISDLIAHVRSRYPKLKVRMELGIRDALLEKLHQGELDVTLFIGEGEVPANHGTVHLFDAELALVTAAGNDLATLKTLSVKELDTIPLILQQKGAGARDIVLEYLDRHGARPAFLLDNLSSDVIKPFLYKMRAAAFISRFIVQKELDEGSLHEIKMLEDTPVSSFYLSYMKSQHLPEKIAHFLAGAEGFHL